jgi:hypothetical protein
MNNPYWKVDLACAILNRYGEDRSYTYVTYYVSADNKEAAIEKAESWLPPKYVVDDPGSCSVIPFVLKSRWEKDKEDDVFPRPYFDWLLHG